MDPHRGNYQEDTESRRYRGDHQQPTGGQTWFEPQSEEDYRYAGRRSADRPQYAAPPGVIGQGVPPAAEHRQHAAPETPQREPAPHWDPNLAPPQHWDPSAAPAPATPARESRRTGGRSTAPSAGAKVGRSAIAVILAVVVFLAEVPVVRVLLSGAFGPTRSAGAVVAGLLLLLGLPLGAIGLHGLTGEAARAAGPVASWLRPPVAYLAVALVMFLAAGLAGRASI